MRVDSKKMEYGPGTMYAAFPSSLGFRVAGQSYSNFLASTVGIQHISGAFKAALCAYMWGCVCTWCTLIFGNIALS